jgi:hypothetical protein
MGIAFLVAIYRDVLIFNNPHLEQRYEQTIAQALFEADIPSFILREHTDKLTLDRARVAWNDPHPSREAADLLAKQIYGELASRGLLPELTQ